MIQSQTKFVIYNTIGERTYNCFPTVESYSDLVDSLNADTNICRINYIKTSEISMKEDFEMVCKAIKCSHHLVFAIDEVDLHSNPQYMPEVLEYLVSIGRHREISVWVVSRRPYLIHPLIRSQCSRLITFRQDEPRDIDWLKAIIGNDVDKLSSLKQFEPLLWTDNLTVEETP